VSFPVDCDPSSSPQAVIEQIQAVPYTVELVEAEVDESGKVNPKGLANQGGKRTSEDGRKWWDFDWMRRHDEEEANSKSRKVLVAKKVSMGFRVIFVSRTDNCGRARFSILLKISYQSGLRGGDTRSIYPSLS